MRNNEYILAAVIFLVIIIIEVAAFRKWMFVRRFSLAGTERVISIIYVIHIISSAILLYRMALIIFDADTDGSWDAAYLYFVNCLVFLVTLYFFLVKTRLEERKWDKQFKTV